MNLRNVNWIVVTMPIWLLTTNPASAARLLNFEVELNGKKILSAIHDDDGSADASTVWSYLRDKKLSADPPASLSNKTGDLNHSDLQGNIVIRAMHAQRTIAEAKVTELKLVRADAHTDQWSLAPGEVERTASVAGLSALPTTASPRGTIPMVFTFAGLTGVVLIIGIWLFVRRQPTAGI